MAETIAVRQIPGNEQETEVGTARAAVDKPPLSERV
jgi:hypothetical protein